MTHHKPISGLAGPGGRATCLHPPDLEPKPVQSITFYYCVSHLLRIFSSYAFPTTYLQRSCRVQRSFNRQDGRSKHLVGSVIIEGHLRKTILLLSELKLDGPFGILSSVGLKYSKWVKFIHEIHLLLTEIH